MKKIIKILYIIVFFLLLLLFGNFHEPWSDEAQSYLLARDASLYDIFFYYASYEGCFPLWICILKLFINLGLSYEFLYVIPAVIATISVSILIFNNNIDSRIKYLIPFGYWFFYQYSIIARNYSLLLIFFAIFLLLYDKRHEKKCKYVMLLIFVSMINVYGMIISGILFLQFFIENLKNEKHTIFLYLLIGFTYFFEIIVLYPKVDTLVSLKYYNNIFTNILNILLITVTYQGNNLIQILNIVILVFLVIILFYIKRRENNITFSLIEITLVLFLIQIRGTNHHLGIIYIVILMDIILSSKKINISKKLYVMLILVLVFYIILNVKTVYDDFSEIYSGSYEMSQYIKENLEDEEIFGIGYRCTALLPYFEENIFSNRSNTFYEWKYSNKDNYICQYCLILRNQNYNIFDDIGYYPKYILLEQRILYKNSEDWMKSIVEGTNLYEIVFSTEGYNFFKGNYNEKEGYILYKLKGE